MNNLLNTPLSELMAEATALRDAGWGNHVSYSRKVFIPLTELCRDAYGSGFYGDKRRGCVGVIHRTRPLAELPTSIGKCADIHLVRCICIILPNFIVSWRRGDGP